MYSQNIAQNAVEKLRSIDINEVTKNEANSLKYESDPSLSGASDFPLALRKNPVLSMHSNEIPSGWPVLAATILNRCFVFDRLLFGNVIVPSVDWSLLL